MRIFGKEKDRPVDTSEWDELDWICYESNERLRKEREKEQLQRDGVRWTKISAFVGILAILITILIAILS